MQTGIKIYARPYCWGWKSQNNRARKWKRLNQLANAAVLFVCSRRRWSSFPGYLLLLRPSVTSVAQWPLVEAAEPVRMAFHYSSTDNNRSIYVLFLRQVTGDPEQLSPLSSQQSNNGRWVGGFGVWTASSRRRRKNEEVAPEKEERTGAIRPISLYTASIYSHIANWKIALQGGSGSGSLVYWWQEGRNTQIDNASRRKDNELGTQSRSPLTDWLAQANWNFTNVSRTTTKSTTFRIGCILDSIHVSGQAIHPSVGPSFLAVIVGIIMFNKCSVGSNYLIPARMRMTGDANLMRFGAAVLLSGDFSVTLSVINQESVAGPVSG